MLGYVVGVLLSVISAALMLRHLSKPQYASYAVVVSLITILGGLSDVGLTSVAVREYAVREASERRRLLSSLLGLRLTMTVIGVALACLFGLIVGYPLVVIEGTVLAGLGLLLLVTQDTYSVPLNVSLQLGRTTALDLIRQVGLVVSVIVLVAAGAGVVPFTATQIPGGIVAVLLAARLARAAAPRRPSFDLQQWRDLLRVVLPYAAAAAIGVIYFQVEIILLSLVSNYTQTSEFAAAFRVTQVVIGIPALVVTAAFPLMARAARDDRERMAGAMQRMFETVLAAGVGMALAIFLGAGFGIAVVGGAKYHGSVTVLQIQAATVIATFLVSLWGYSLLSLHRHRALLFANAAGLVSAAGLTAWLASEYGAIGASVSLVVTETVMATGYYVALRRSSGLVPSLAIVPRIALAAGVALAIGLIAPLPSVAQAILGSLLYLLGLVLLRALPPEIVHLLPARAKRAGP